MRLAVVAIVFTAVVAATPYPWAAPQGSLVTETKPKPNRTKVNRTRKNPHKEPTPTFKLGCDCAKPIIPMNLLSANERCLMEHASAMGCYIGSKGGCPSPAPACGLGVLPVVPFAN
ncbi:hypothetical protein GQ44DRAFT_732791 [Phaeosphaeriaceae sp. PMI808]|nr:hypothetical protein GQ44DRAFT_732791 [Phaeosphaeriaceae sp. PMI808]